MRARPSLRTHLLFGSLVLSWIPIVLLAVWAYHGAAERALDEVRERHLMVSRHLTLALDRYARDAEAAFRLAMTTAPADKTRISKGTALSSLLRDLGFRHICVVDGERRIQHAYCALDCPAADTLPQRTLDQIPDVLAEVEDTPGKVSWSGVIENPGGVPVVILALHRDDGLLAVGELALDYVRSLQTAVKFGDKGHAAIVDAKGRVLAHPRAQWEQERKDISKVSAVQAMMRGESGVIEFYSPAMRADMIAGFSTVPYTGWGVMVPQPVAELYRHARDVAWAALVIGVAMMGVTGIVSWLLARRLARAFEPLRTVADRIEQGDLSARIHDSLPSAAPREFHAVSKAVDDMMDRLAASFRAEAAAQIEALRAEAQHRAKAGLLAHVSHELRTPLNAILGFSDIIRSELLGKIAQRRYVDYANDIQESGRHLLKLIDQTLELARSERGDGSSDDEEWLDLSHLAARALEIVTVASGSRRRRRRLDVQPGLPLVRLGRARFMQVLINLIDNAEKYTEEDGLVGVTVRVDGAGRPVVTVEDDGIGMTAEDVAVSTMPFGRSRNPLVRLRDGAGLGLSVVATIVERLGAGLAIVSEPGKGTSVSVTLPRERCQEGQVYDLQPSPTMS